MAFIFCHSNLIKSLYAHSNSKMLAFSTVKHLSQNYASFQQPSVQEWYSLSTSCQTQNIPNGIPLTFMEMDIFLQNAGTSKDLRIALKVCVMLTLNTAVFKLILLSLKEKDSLTIPQIPFVFSDYARSIFTS